MNQDLFGGDDGYEKLPELNKPWSSSIKPEDLNEPIMRGQDSLGRDYFAIRCQVDGHLCCHIFLETLAGRWLKQSRSPEKSKSIRLDLDQKELDKLAQFIKKEAK